MALTATQFGADFDNMAGDLSQAVTFAGSPYTMIRDSVDERHIPDVEGLRTNYRFSLWLKRSDFTTSPTVNDIIDIGGTEYRVLQLSDDPLDAIRRLDMGEKFADSPLFG